MENKFFEIYKLRSQDYSRNDKITPYAMLDLFQDVAGKHVATLNAGYADLLNNGYLWILVRERYVIIKDIPLYANVKVMTYPKEKSLVDFDREFVITDENDNVYVKAISKWVIIDKNTRRIIPAKKVPYEFEPVNENMFDKIDKLHDFDINGAKSYEYKIEYNDLDHNGHVNNTRYAYMITNALCLKNNENIIDFQIDFIHETKENEKVIIYYIKDNDTYHIKGVVNDTTSFIALIKINI